MFPDLSKLVATNPTADVPFVSPDACNDLNCDDYQTFRGDILDVNAHNDGWPVFHNRGPRGEHFYGSATLEQLNRVHIHNGGLQQSPNGSKLRITNRAREAIWINY